MRTLCPALAVLVVIAQSSVSADVLIVEKTVVKSGDKTIAGVRSTFIKGPRMRVELAQNGQTAVTVYDLPAGQVLELETSKQKANVRTVAARSAKLEKEYPRARSTVSLTPAGQSLTLLGTPCDVQRFAVRVPMSSSGEIVLTLDGTACMAAQANGVDDYQTFARTAAEQNVVLGQASDNYILLAVARGQTELYRALAARGGVPLAIDMAFGVDGKGVLAGIARKPVEGTRVTTVTKLDVSPQSDAMFAVPAGWKKELKQ